VAHSLDQLSPLVSEVVYFAARESIRNAARHAAADDKLPGLKITASQQAKDLQIVLEDSGGRSIRPQRKEPGSGQGLALHSTMMAVIGGELSFEQVPEQTARVVLRVPLTK
jgi:signal transduction histidine kinase